MRATTLLRRLVDVTGTRVTGVRFFSGGEVSVEVAPLWRKPRCGVCGRRAPAYDRRPLRWWRHLVVGARVVLLAYAPRRVHCRRCGVRTEQVPWGASASRFSWAFEEWVAYLAQITDQTKVHKLTGVAWSTVGQIIERVVSRRLSPERLSNLRRIGIDEFSYRKRHRYLTIVVDHDRRRVVWAAEGRSAETLSGFFREVGPQACAAIELVSIDMAGGYKKAIAEFLPGAQVIYDRFHVQRLASDALDAVRRSLVREAAAAEDDDSDESQAIKKTRWVLLKGWHRLDAGERARLHEVQRTNRPLYRGYLLKETLAGALDYRQPARAEKALRSWIAWAGRSRLRPFVRVARTLRAHFAGVLAYIQHRLTNGLAEGLNNKLRMISRRAYGFHSAEALIAMLFLNAGGIKLSPRLPPPTPC
jgi:transposase